MIPDFTALTREPLGEQPPPPELDETSRWILDATTKLVGENGERRLTVDDIAAASQVARATIFRRFGSKDALIGRMYERETRKGAEVLRAATTAASNPRTPSRRVFRLCWATPRPIS